MPMTKEVFEAMLKGHKIEYLDATNSWRGISLNFVSVNDMRELEWRIAPMQVERRNFPSTVQWLRQGRRVRRAIWDIEIYIELRNSVICWGNGTTAAITAQMLGGNDWELAE